MKHLIKRIHMMNYLYFTKDELDAGGTNHNKPLYITVRCNDCTIGKVLVDNGSTLNVLSKHVLNEMPIDSTHILLSTMMARVYDGFPMKVVGTIKIELCIGPQVFLVTLQVINIHPSYTILLGRFWIHVVRTVASSLHQCLKYIVNETLVIVKVKETMKIVKNVVVPYIEAKGEKMEIFMLLRLLM